MLEIRFIFLYFLKHNLEPCSFGLNPVQLFGRGWWAVRGQRVKSGVGGCAVGVSLQSELHTVPCVQPAHSVGKQPSPWARPAQGLLIAVATQSLSAGSTDVCWACVQCQALGWSWGNGNKRLILEERRLQCDKSPGRLPLRLL